MYNELKTKDIMKSPLAAITLPVGYESVYKYEGKLYFRPIVAATFQNFIENDNRDNISHFKGTGVAHTVSTLWEMSPDGLEPLTFKSDDFIGIKSPEEALDKFLERVKEEVLWETC